MTSSTSSSSLTLHRVLPLISSSATNEEKIAALSIIPTLISSHCHESPPLLDIHQSLDYTFIRRLLASKSASSTAQHTPESTSFPLIALHIMSVLSSNQQIAHSPEFTALVDQILNLIAKFPCNQVQKTALELLFRIGNHDNEHIAKAILSHSGPILDIMVRLYNEDPKQLDFVNFIIMLSKSAGPSIDASIPLLTQIHQRMESHVSSTISPESASSLTVSSMELLISLFTQILEIIPCNRHLDIARRLSLSTTVQQLLRTRSAPEKLTRQVLRLASAYLVHAPTGLSDNPKTWMTVISAAAIDLQLILDTDHIDNLVTSTAFQDWTDRTPPLLTDTALTNHSATIELALTSNCLVIESQMAALVNAKISIPTDYLMLWKQQASQLMLSVGSILAPISVDSMHWSHSTIILSVCRLACYILCESEELGIFPELNAGVGDTAQTAPFPDSNMSETHVNVILAPLIIHLITDPNVPRHVLPWASAYMALVSADDRDSVSLISGLNMTLYMEKLIQVLQGITCMEDCIVVTHFASTLLNILVLGDKSQASKVIGKIRDSLSALAEAALQLQLSIDTLLGISEETCQALGTLSVCLAMTLRSTVQHHQVLPNPVLTRDSVTNILQITTTFVSTTWRSSIDLNDLVHLIVDYLKEVCQTNQFVHSIWNDLSVERQVLFCNVHVPIGFTQEARFLGVV